MLKWILVALIALAASAWFIVVAVFATTFSAVGVTGGVIGLAMTLRLGISRGMALYAGYKTDGLRPKPATKRGFLIISGAFVLLAVAGNNSLVILTAAIGIGLGMGLVTAPAKGVIARLTPEGERRKMFAILSAVVNGGAFLGPNASLVLQKIDSRFPFLLAAGVAAVGYLIVCCLPDLPSGERKGGVKEAIRTIVSHRDFTRIAIISVGFWSLYTTMFDYTMPLTSEKMQFGLEALFNTNSLIVITMSVVITSWVERNLPTNVGNGLGFVLIGCSLNIMTFPSVWAIGVASAAFTAGEIILTTALEADAVKLAPDQPGTALGIVALIGALGPLAMSQVVGWVFPLAQAAQFFSAASLLATLVGIAVVLSNQRGK